MKYDSFTGISAPFIRRPIATSLVAMAIMAVGLIAYPFLPVAALPHIDFPTIQVNANMPGVSPETAATSLAQPLERQFAQIPGVTQMTSTSGLGAASISLQFDLDRNIDAAAQDVQAAISAATGQLPRNMPSPPRYAKANPAEPPILMYAFQSDVLPLTVINDYVENVIVQRLTQIRGVASVTVGGQQKPAIRIQIDPVKLAGTGLSLEDVRAALATGTSNAPKGYIDGPNRTFTIYDNSQITQVEQYRSLVLAYRNGAPVRVDDVGDAVLAAENIRSGAWEQNGKQGIEILINKTADANVIETVGLVKAILPELVAALPPSIFMLPIVDRTQTIRASVAEVQFTLLISVLLVIGVIFVFLRNMWATIIPAVAIPLSLVGTCAAMYLLGFSIDNLSLMAMTISVGFVVDDAIVMLENIYRYMEEGMDSLSAALKGAGEIGFTIVSISLSLVAVFIPLLMMGGIVGRLLREFAITVTLTIIISMVVSLTLTPMMCSRFLRPDHGQERPIYRRIGQGFEAMRAFYERTLDWALRHQKSVFISFLVTVAASVALYLVIPKGFFPQQDTGVISGTIEGATDISYTELKAKRQAVSDIVMRDPDVVGMGSPIGLFGRAGNTAAMMLSLKPHGERDATADQIINRLRPQLAQVEGASAFFTAAQDINVGGRAAKAQYQFTLQDPDLEELNTWTPRVVAKLRTLPILQDVSSDQQVGTTTQTLVINRDQAARLGVTPAMVDETLYDAFGQRPVAQFYTQVNTYNVILEITPALQGDPRFLGHLYVKSNTGAQVPLSAFVKADTRPIAPMSINHQGGFPATTVSFNLSPGVSLGEAVNAVESAYAEIGPPAALRGTFQGAAQVFQSSLANQPYLIAAAILAVYIILGVLYESYLYPLAILSTLPSAGVGALLTLTLFGYDLSVIGLIGVILLIGIVKKNGIMIVDFAIQAQRNEGMSPLDAVRRACLLRFRPIMMTTAAAVLGSFPLIIGHGAGSELRQPLGYAVVGGLLVSQVLTLYSTPVVYLYLERLRGWFETRRSAKQLSPAE